MSSPLCPHLSDREVPVQLSNKTIIVGEGMGDRDQQGCRGDEFAKVRRPLSPQLGCGSMKTFMESLDYLLIRVIGCRNQGGGRVPRTVVYSRNITGRNTSRCFHGVEVRYLVLGGYISGGSCLVICLNRIKSDGLLILFVM